MQTVAGNQCLYYTFKIKDIAISLATEFAIYAVIVVIVFAFKDEVDKETIFAVLISIFMAICILPFLMSLYRFHEENIKTAFIRAKENQWQLESHSEILNCMQDGILIIKNN